MILDREEQGMLLEAAVAGADEDLRDAAADYAHEVRADRNDVSQTEIENSLSHLRVCALRFAALIFAQRGSW